MLAGETFARSEQLRAFLRYVCEREIEGATPIAEYDIGVNALGRPRDFAPGEDSSVRTRAYELRQRLQKYYSTESPTSPLRIDLPKGSYTPRFSTVEPVEAVPLVAEPASPVPGPRVTRAGLLAGFLCGFAVAAAGGVLWVTAGRAPDRMLRQAWAPMAQSDAEVLLCPAAPLHYLIAPATEGVPSDPRKTPAPKEAYDLFSRYRPLRPGTSLDMQPVQKVITMGTVQAISRTTAVLDRLNRPYRILPETSSPLPAMRHRNVFLFGSPWYSRAVSTLLEHTPWTIGPSASTGEIVLRNSGREYAPKHGARGEYREVFGLITVLPSEPSADDGHTFVIFSGLTSAGVEGAAAFFSSPRDLAVLWTGFEKGGMRGWPRSYQVVVRCRTTEDTQLLSYAYETHAVLQR